MSTKGQTINDRLNAAKYTLAGQALARCICKSTTEELMKPKKKHLDYLAASTYQPNVSMQQLTNLLIERTSHSNWAVVYKALITVHHLMCHGSERFTQYLASSNYSFQLSNFIDRNVTKGYEMSEFIRRYSNYINEKALSYRKLAVDLCRSQRRKGETDSLMRTMPIERLLETLPVIQKQMDTLLDFGPTAGDLNNSIITASFTLLFHDAIRLFASYNDGIINLFEKYFDLNKKMCREAFEAYKKFLACTDRVADFLKVAAAINLNNEELPDFKHAPSSLLDAFEQHLISLETNKKRDTTKLDVDTRLAAFPSFTVNNDSDSAAPQTTSHYTDSESTKLDSQQTLGEISREFEAQLNFATSDNDFNLGITSLSSSATNNTQTSNNLMNNNSKTNKNALNDIFSNQPFDDQLASVAQSFDISNNSHGNIFYSNNNNNNNNNNLNSANDEPFMSTMPVSNTAALSAISSTLTTNDIATSSSATPASSTILASSAGHDLFDIKPPGFSGGALLTPESLQINIDPSVDAHTKQQIIQIKREQVLANRGNISSQNHNQQQQQQSNLGSGKHQAGLAKPTKESMFEDLEKTMRQSFFKAENT